MHAPTVNPAAHFTTWMFRAYLDLGPVPPGAPHHLFGLDFGIRSLAENRLYPRIQSALNPSFRDLLIRQAEAPEYDVRSPLELAPALRTERWQLLCDACSNFSGLSPDNQVRLAWTLGKLCFQRYLLALIPESVVDEAGKSQANASLAYLRAYSRYRLYLDDPREPYDVSEFAAIAAAAPPGIAHVDAHYQVVVQNVKHHNNLQVVEEWQERHRAAIERAKPELSEFEFLRVMSRYHRVGGFIPQIKRDKQGTIAEMDLAERFARELPRTDEVYALAADEMLYPVLESRTKESIWLGDLDLALERALATTKLSPFDARAWLHLGQVYVERDDPENARAAYRLSARYSPPGKEIACFMAGQCSEVLDDLEAACDEYLASLTIDPLGIASVERLVDVSGQLGHGPLVRWSKALLEELTRRGSEQTVERAPEPYKHLPPPLQA